MSGFGYRDPSKQDEKNIRESCKRRLEELERFRIQFVVCIFLLHKLSEQIKFDILVAKGAFKS